MNQLHFKSFENFSLDIDLLVHLYYAPFLFSLFSFLFLPFPPLFCFHSDYLTNYGIFISLLLYAHPVHTSSEKSFIFSKQQDYPRIPLNKTWIVMPFCCTFCFFLLDLAVISWLSNYHKSKNTIKARILIGCLGILVCNSDQNNK